MARVPPFFFLSECSEFLTLLRRYSVSASTFTARPQSFCPRSILRAVCLSYREQWIATTPRLKHVRVFRHLRFTRDVLSTSLRNNRRVKPSTWQSFVL